MSFIFHNCSVIDGISSTPRSSCDVIVDDGRIVAIENSQARTQEAYHVIDATGLTLLPGLIDCHSHYTIDPREADGFAVAERKSDAEIVLRAARNAREALHAGITTTRDAGAPRQLNFALRDAIAAKRVPGPRILAPGCAITITGGHGMQFGVEADGMDELQKAVRTQMRDGADVVKVVSSEAAMLTGGAAACEEMSQAELDMLVYEARRRGLRIFSHAQNSTSVTRSARAGVDSLEHAFLADAEALAVMRECGTTLVPTLAVTAVTLENPNLASDYRARMKTIRRQHWASCEDAIRQGVSVVPGTDCGVFGILPNLLWREIYELHARGLSKMDALRAATSVAAALLGIENQVGSVEVGKEADIILVFGDPLADLAVLRDVALVMQGGRIVFERMSSLIT